VLGSLLKEDLNFLVTNRIPRRFATRLVGWFSKVDTGALTPVTIAIWRAFAGDVDLHEAKERRFRCLRDVFVRELREGARPIDADPDVLTSPCDAVLGAHGHVRGTRVYQAKGYPYRLEELLPDAELVERYRDGFFLTLRLRSSFYHRFHAPCDGRLEKVLYVSGDTWNVNPIALTRVERLFCKNERAVLDLVLREPGQSVALVAVAAILVASIRIHAIGPLLDLRYRGPNEIPCSAAFAKGEELGWFENGSTIVLFASRGFELRDELREGSLVKVGEPLLRRPRQGG
jgi:phosphatidylserine decarboxylase